MLSRTYAESGAAAGGDEQRAICPARRVAEVRLLEGPTEQREAAPYRPSWSKPLPTTVIIVPPAVGPPDGITSESTTGQCSANSSGAGVAPTKSSSPSETSTGMIPASAGQAGVRHVKADSLIA